MKPSKNAEFPVYENNVSPLEANISFVAGSYFMYKAFKKGSLSRAALGGYLMLRGATGYCPGYQFFGKTKVIENHNINVRTSVIVEKPRHEVYSFWRNLDNLQLFMDHIEEVHTVDNTTSGWRAKIPGNIASVHWISEIVDDQKNERIGWRSLPGSDIMNAGNVHFEDVGSNATKINAIITYEPAGGTAGETLGKLFNPVFEKIVRDDIINFKEYIENLETEEGQDDEMAKKKSTEKPTPVAHVEPRMKKVGGREEVGEIKVITRNTGE